MPLVFAPAGWINKERRGTVGMTSRVQRTTERRKVTGAMEGTSCPRRNTLRVGGGALCACVRYSLEWKKLSERAKNQKTAER